MTASKSARAAAEYAKLPDVERCAMAGRLMRETWYAYVYRPDDYERLLAAKLCLRPNQIPAWVYKDIDDESRVPEHLQREDFNRVRTQVFIGGRASGKTFAANAYWIVELLERPEMRLEVLGPSFGVSSGVTIIGRSGIKTLIDKFDKSLIVKFDEVKYILHLVNGSKVFCKSSEYPKSVEGPEYHALQVEEPAELMNAGGENCIYRKRAEPGVRLVGDKGEPIRKIVSGTPEATDLIKDLWDSHERSPKRYAWSQLSMRENEANLDQETVDQLYEESSAEFVETKLDGVLKLSSPHALLNDTQIAAIRLTESDERHREPEQLDEVILAIDTQSADDKKSDECGIAVMGVSTEPELSGKLAKRARVLADASCSGGSTKWGVRIVEVLVAYPEIVEVCVEDEGFATDVVTRVIEDAMETIGRPITIKKMPHGNKSKKVRADPIAGMYQVKRMYHDPCSRTPQWASLAKLEFQWVSWNPKKTGPGVKSPDRVDAVVYGGTRLLLRDRNPDSFFSASSVTW